MQRAPNVSELAALRRTVRFQAALLAGSLILAGYSCWRTVPPRAEAGSTLDDHGLTVRDEHGIPRIILRLLPEGPEFRMNDDQGETQAALTGRDGGRLALGSPMRLALSGSDNSDLRSGRPPIELFDYTRKQRVLFAADTDGAKWILADASGRVRLELRMDETNGEFRFRLHDGDGREVPALPTPRR